MRRSLKADDRVTCSDVAWGTLRVVRLYQSPTGQRAVLQNECWQEFDVASAFVQLTDAQVALDRYGR